MQGRWVIPVLVVMSACLADTVDLSYGFEEGTTTTYQMTARADASWDVAGRGEGSYEVGFEVTETVRNVDEDGAIVDVRMIPTGAEEQGLPSPGLERRSFSLLLGPEGEVVEVLQLDGIEARSLDEDELAFIGTYRPALPSEPVTLHDEWSQSREIRLGADIQGIETTGQLVGLRRDDERGLAEVVFTGNSPLRWTTRLPQGEAELTGEATTRGRGLFEIDGGLLDSATSRTSGRFEVRVIPGGGRAPITGMLHLELALEVERSA